MNIYQIVAVIIGVVLMGSFVAGGIRDLKTGDYTWKHPGSTAIRLTCAFALLADVVAANLFR